MDEKVAGGWVLRFVESSFAKWLALIASALALLIAPFAFDPVQDAFFKKTNFAVELTSEIPIFDINRQLEGLRVEFQGRDLTASQQGVIVSQVQLRNIGDVAVTPQKTTPLDPLGFRVVGGTLVRLTRVSASSRHLLDRIELKRTGNQITVNQGLIFEPGDFVRFDLLVTRPLRGGVTYQPLGKIEGMRAISFRTPATQVQQKSLPHRVFDGDALVQVLRVLAYGFIGLIALILVMLSSIQISELRAKSRTRKRTSLMEVVLRASAPGERPIFKVLSRLYVSSGMSGLTDLQRRLKDRAFDEPVAPQFAPPADVDVPPVLYRRWRVDPAVRRALEQFEVMGLVTRDQKLVSDRVVERLDQFINLVREQAPGIGIALARIEP